jgi:GTP-binding protein EngB required for normal cell division
MDEVMPQRSWGQIETALLEISRVAQERADLGIASEAEQALQGLGEGRFNIALVGQFKRGKSSLINALLGREYLPADVAPLTNVISVVQHGVKERVRLFFLDGREENSDLPELFEFVSEEANPNNVKGVREVWVELPLPLLKGGMRLVDTPGVGSIFAVSGEVTKSYLPRIDVAVFVLGSDPPISGEEINLVRAVAPISSRIIFGLNKCDLVPEANRQKAETFTRRALTEALGHDPGPLLHFSALKALQGDQDSGVPELLQELKKLSGKTGPDLAGQSAARAMNYLSGRLIQQIDLERMALEAPLGELARRIEGFESATGDLKDLMETAFARAQAKINYDWQAWKDLEQKTAEEEKKKIMEAVQAALKKEGKRKPPRLQRIKPKMPDQAHALRRGIFQARELLQAVLDFPPIHRAREREKWRREFNALALTQAREQILNFLELWSAQAAEWLAQNYQPQADNVARETNRLMERVADAAGEAFGIPIAKLEVPQPAVNLKQIPFEFWEASLALDYNDWLMPVWAFFATREDMAQAAEKKSAGAIDNWLLTNLNRVDEYLINWIDAGTRGLLNTMRERLEGMKQEIMAAVDSAKKRRGDGQRAVSQRLQVLSEQRRRLDGSGLGTGSP